MLVTAILILDVQADPDQGHGDSPFGEVGQKYRVSKDPNAGWKKEKTHVKRVFPIFFLVEPLNQSLSSQQKNMTLLGP